jgi:hypothetical protein
MNNYQKIDNISALQNVPNTGSDIFSNQYQNGHNPGMGDIKRDNGENENEDVEDSKDDDGKEYF